MWLTHPAFNSVDYVAFALILIGTVVGFRRGMMGHLGFVFIALVVVATAVNAYTPVRDWLAARFPFPPDRLRLVTLLIVILAPLIVGVLVNRLVGWGIKVTFVRWVDRIGGAVCGFLSSCALVVLAFVVVNLPPERLRPPGVGQDSWIGSRIVVVENQIEERIESRVKATREDIRKAHDDKVRERGEWWAE